MKFPKITKILPVALALAMTTSCSFAAEDVLGDGSVQSKVSAEYQLFLDTFFDIDVAAPAGNGNITFDEDYTTITITEALVGKFEVVSNTTEKQFHLYGQCVAGTTLPAIYGTPGALKIVFTNQTNKATDDAVKHITGGGKVSTSSPNAIAFNLQESYSHEETPQNAWKTEPSFDKTKITYDVYNGKHFLTYTVTGNAVDNSFSTMDTNGTYKATLTLTDTAL